MFDEVSVTMVTPENTMVVINYHLVIDGMDFSMGAPEISEYQIDSIPVNYFSTLSE